MAVEVEKPLGRDDVYNEIHPEGGAVEFSLEIPDEEWVADNVPQILDMRQYIVDDSPFSQGADLVSRVMTEFAVEGSEFQPSQDDELARFIAEVLQREVPDLSEDEVVELIELVNDFPPTDMSQRELSYQERLAKLERMSESMGATAARQAFATAA